MTESPEKFRIRVVGTKHWMGPRWISEALQESTMPNAGVKLRGALYPARWWVPEVRAKVWPNIGQLKGSVTKAGVRGFPILEVILEDGTVRALDDVMKECL